MMTLKQPTKSEAKEMEFMKTNFGKDGHKFNKENDMRFDSFLIYEHCEGCGVTMFNWASGGQPKCKKAGR